MRRRVVITGMGAISPLGDSVKDLYENQLRGKSGVGPIALFDASTFPTKFAAQVKNFDLARYVRDASRWAHAGSNSRLAAAAAQQALDDAGLIESRRVDRTRFGVYLGSGEGIQDFHNFVSLIGENYQAATHGVDTMGFIKGGLRASIPAPNTNRRCTPRPVISPTTSISKAPTTIA